MIPENTHWNWHKKVKGYWLRKTWKKKVKECLDNIYSTKIRKKKGIWITENIYSVWDEQQRQITASGGEKTTVGFLKEYVKITKKSTDCGIYILCVRNLDIVNCWQNKCVVRENNGQISK